MMSSTEQELIFSEVLSNVTICDKIFSKLSTEDLKSCRLVCSFWNQLIIYRSEFARASCILFDGQKELGSYDDFIQLNKSYYNRSKTCLPFKKYFQSKSKRDADETSQARNYRDEFIQEVLLSFLTQHSSQLSFYSRLIFQNLSLTQTDQLTTFDDAKLHRTMMNQTNKEDLATKYYCYTNQGTNVNHLPFFKAEFIEAVQNITSLCLDGCYFQSKDRFLNFIGNFGRLTSLAFHNSYFTWFKKEDLRLILGIYNNDVANVEPKNNIAAKLKNREGIFSKIKSISLQHKLLLQDSTITQCFNCLLELLLNKDCNCQLESCCILMNSVGNVRYSNTSKRFVSLLGQLYTKHMKTLKIARLELWNHTNGYFTGLAFFQPIWENLRRLFHESPLQELKIDCPELKIYSYDHVFFNDLILLWISDFKHLQVLEITNLYLYDDIPLVVELIYARGGQIKFGIVLADDANTYTVRTRKDILAQQIMMDILTEITFQFQTSDCSKFGNLFPTNPNEPEQDYEGGREQIRVLVYKYVKKLHFSFETRLPDYNCYDLLDVTQLFPNLNSIRISDAVKRVGQRSIKNIPKRNPTSSYSNTNVCFTDENMQLILRSLIQLQDIYIDADLRSLSDFGLTGIRKNDKGERDAPGVSFSNLKKLRSVSLSSFGRKITNKSLKYGFNKLFYLETVHLAGSTKINKRGVKVFKELYENRVQIRINEQ